MTHKLKVWPEQFRKLVSGAKKAEFRKNDREEGYRYDDMLILMEYDPERKAYTGECFKAMVSHIVFGPDFGIPEGYCMMSLRYIERFTHIDYLP
jgi:hypothetical protein